MDAVMILSGGIVFAVGWLAQQLIQTRLSNQVKHEYDLDLERHRFVIRRNEQIQCLAELLARKVSKDEKTTSQNKLLYQIILMSDANTVRKVNSIIERDRGNHSAAELLIHIRKEVFLINDDLREEEILTY